jgi:galactose mutarotase-like enzyme
MGAESGTVTLQAGGASAVVALNGAEPRSWRVAGRELLWHADPAHWDRSAPILFPVVGASAGGAVRVGGRPYPMPQHGFARDSRFAVVERRPDAARLRLTDDAATRAHYPFAFVLEVTVALAPEALSLGFTVVNPNAVVLPYALGFHPAFLWPFDASGRDGHAIVFEAAETPAVPLVTRDALLRRQTRPVALDGAVLPLAPELFARDALVFLDAASRSLRFVSPSGATIAVAAEDFPHLALWTKPAAPFLSIETWTGHADWENAVGELCDRASMRLLAPGAQASHAVHLTFTP